MSNATVTLNPLTLHASKILIGIAIVAVTGLFTSQAMILRTLPVLDSTVVEHATTLDKLVMNQENIAATQELLTCFVIAQEKGEDCDIVAMLQKGKG